MSIANDPLLGKVIQGYEFVDIIGRGAFGAVYLARHPNLKNRFLAVKYIEVKDLRDAADVRREIDILEKLDYRYIVRIENTFPFEGILDQTNRPRPRLIMMEYVRGGSLQGLLSKLDGKLLNYNAIIKCASQVAAALNYVHGEEILHLDLKPANILLRPNPDTEVPDFVLTDFGIAQFTRPGEELSRWGGTPPYMSPEHFSFAKGRGPDHRSDVYSLGIVMYQLVTGTVPFKGAMHEIALKHLEEPAPPLSTYVPDVPPDLEHIIMRALEKDRDRRYQSAAELRAALTDITFASIQEIPARVPNARIGQAIQEIVRSVDLPDYQPTGFKLLVIHPDGSEHEHTFDHFPIIVGRSTSCDLTLPSNHISRQHLRLDAKGSDMVLVTDLNSTHGTYLNERKLEPGKAVECTSDHWLYVNDYSIRVIGTEAVASAAAAVAVAPADIQQTTVYEAVPGQPASRPQTTMVEAELKQIAGQLRAESSPPRLNMEVSPEILYVQFGRPEYITVRVQPEHVEKEATYRVQLAHGAKFDPAWCNIARPKVIRPGEVATFDVAINLPHSILNQDVELVLGVVADDPAIPEAIRVVQIKVQRQVDYRVALNPNRVVHPRFGSALTHLSITNTGTNDEQFNIEIEAPASLHVDLRTTQITVAPGQKEDIPIRLRFAGGTQEVFLPYTLHVALPGTAPRQAQGTYVVLRQRSLLLRLVRTLLFAIILGVILALVDQYLLDQRIMLALRQVLAPVLSFVRF